MKVETNFADPIRPIALATTLATWFIAFMLAVAAVVLWLDASSRKADVREATVRLQQLEARRAELRVPANGPSGAEIAALQARVATVNALSVTNGRRIVPLLALFEQLLPADAWVVSLSHKARDGEIVLVAEAPQAEQLTQFLLGLEKSARFAEVLLLRQTPLTGEGRRGVQFELRLRERT
ncbi:MAG: PilN domain-containing protein [Sulfurifustis sp.]